ncbi:glycogen/starch synthase [Solitalea lacus]|uniref:glycogen/starch synthase n=1 Tax=Solitalea lacus TaxID=2911172 RepID=UPI001EDB68F9|nr:glycogen/starch synthase [Solitalea lacus]UKJ07566.1 glycogen/starch synthase [Solitalea lacus]
MAKKKVLYITHEMSPFLELTEISKITRQLPQAIQEQGYEIRVLMPRFGCINERRNRLHEVIRLSGMNISIDDNDNPLIIKVASIQGAKMQVYFLDNEEYFQRKYVFRDDKEKFFDDNDERTIFFSKGAIETVKKLGWTPDIVHCHGWMSSLVPAYLKTTYKNDPMFKNTKVAYSIYENSFSETLNPAFSKKAVMNQMTHDDLVNYADATNNALHMGAIGFADAIIKGDEKIDPKVEEFITQSGKPLMNYTTFENTEAFAQFYEEMANAELVSA